MLLDFQLESGRSIQDLYLVLQKNLMLVCPLQQEPEFRASVSSKCCAESLCSGSPSSKGLTAPRGSVGTRGGICWSFLVRALYGIAGFPKEHSLHRASVIPGDPAPLIPREQRGRHLWDRRNGQSQLLSSACLLSSVCPKDLIWPYL